MSQDDATCEKAYQEDWNAAGDRLACATWDENGSVLVDRSWPPRGLKYCDKFDLQRDVWYRIANKKVFTGMGRLWRSLKPIVPPLTLKFAPVGGWPGSADLQKIWDELRGKEQGRMDAGKSNLLEWMTAEIVDFGSPALDNQVLLSRNLLEHYETYISLGDFQRLIEAQTQDQQSWARRWLTEEEAESFHKLMTEGPDEKWKQKYKPKMDAGLVVATYTDIFATKSFGNRIDAQEIMGRQSANQVCLPHIDRSTGALAYTM